MNSADLSVRSLFPLAQAKVLSDELPIVVTAPGARVCSCVASSHVSRQSVFQLKARAFSYLCAKCRSVLGLKVNEQTMKKR